jgi:hypothetical protein
LGQRRLREKLIKEMRREAATEKGDRKRRELGEKVEPAKSTWKLSSTRTMDDDGNMMV